MSEAPERGYYWPGEGTFGTEQGEYASGLGIPYTRTDLYDEAVRQRDMLLALVREIRTDQPTVDFWAREWADTGMECPLFTECKDALAACATPPLARGDVKTGKVV